ncbi:MAG TPA: NUDIX hydrolase N-terminal domain-containing protein [Thermoflexales bacterium]|nr:NUDIX hydrolase N-terminal domain-containing protein [Thermoflexales bacterium]HQX10904.1 NUDIX hydrolase N-terminal domain-containing protein [Thermoflexales bacterium]HQY25918.1 NUDIX hydrolase N-terminal domain-containing protein [Thermoflexales bacterium]HQZ53590.1 NUDIX hydrolase N-terminal domain-containing protein [Thermoflexales bacterium]HRA53900.1 NUDIX hydrolase N-terminal domain-containing protein [Thermoflexales bacterium]
MTGGPAQAEVPNWLRWARKIDAIAQAGLTYCESDFDRERYAQLRALAGEILAAQTGADPVLVNGWFAAQPGYATPKVDVRAACFRDGKLLLARERSDGRWCLPGGWADVGDAPSVSAEREVAEETGFLARAKALIGVFDANRNHDDGRPLSYHHGYKLIFACELVGGAPAPANHEILGSGFFARQEIPALSEARTNRAQIAACFAHLDDPARPADFD